MSWVEIYETSYTDALVAETRAIVAGEPAQHLRRATTAAALRLCVVAGGREGYTAKEVELLIGAAPSTIRDAADLIASCDGDFRKALGL